MSQEGLRNDVSYLAGQLPHRGAHTEEERHAALHIEQRFRQSTSFVHVDDFHSFESHALLFASYFAEFFIVAVFASWIPWIAFGYGVAIFLFYVAEFNGYPILSRLMPQFDSQNVTARLLGKSAKRLIVVTANYDSPRALNLSDSTELRHAGPAHLLLVACMIVILASCAAEGAGLFDGGTRYDLYLRWFAVVILTTGAIRAYTLYSRSEFTRGPIDNASSCAVLLELAERFKDEPLEKSDVWLVATGSKESWMAGMRVLMRSSEIDRDATYFLNLAHIGAGTLTYTTREGMMMSLPTAREWRDAARDASEHATEGKPYRWVPTDAMIPLSRGYKAMSIAGLDESGQPAHWTTPDTRAQIDFDRLEQGADYVESVIRKLDSMPAR